MIMLKQSARRSIQSFAKAVTVASLFMMFAGGVVPTTAMAQGKKKAENPVLEEFKKYIKSPQESVRIDQVERLARVQSEESIKLLLDRGLTDRSVNVRDRATESLAKMEGDLRALVASALQHRKNTVREGVALALGKMTGWSEATGHLVNRSQTERDPMVLTAIMEALGLLADPKGTAAITIGLAHKKEQVVIAAADALAQSKDAEGAPGLVPLLDNSSWRVQVAAIHALGRIRSKVGVAPLIAYMDAATGRPRADARRALMRITQRSFGMDAGTWAEWWGRVKDGWKVPPEKKEKPKEEVGNAGYATKPTRYHTIRTYSKKILFVIDVSSSMEIPILVARGKKSRIAVKKLLLAREELASALRGMDKHTSFNIIAFETNVRKWKKSAVEASNGNIQTALRWVEKQKARTINPRRPGSDVDKHGRRVGRTNTYEALAAVFGLRVDPETGAGGTTGGGSSRTKGRPRWDTCFFLSDGRPTEGFMTDIPRILEEVKRWNKNCKMVIHCIGMEFENGLAQLLNGLAALTGGECVFVGK